jgi:transketolase
MKQINHRRLANAIRALSMDAVEKANSGHPGAPMGMADIAEVLWRDFLKHDPKNPNWIDRDRFVLSNGHASMLLYSLLHLSGYDLSLDDLKNFRQLHSRTPGHPEFGYAPGVETTTGPLGQGLANAVGMAMAEKALAARFNQPGFDIVDHHTYVFLGDGCLMEGISHEVCSLAGTLGLGKLVAIYDDNQISIDGDVRGWFTDDTKKRFESYGWRVIDAVDGHDAEKIRAAIEQARKSDGRPTLISCRTQIGFGAPKKAGTAGAHGSPLGKDEIAGARTKLGWEYAPFEIPADIMQDWSQVESGKQKESAWQQKFDAYRSAHPELARELSRRMQGDLPQDFAAEMDQLIHALAAKTDAPATRQSSQAVLTAMAPKLPELIGGSADLTGSNGTKWNGAKVFSRENPSGDYIYYGVREFGMSAIMNGMALHGGFIPFGGTFLMFMEYARNAARMAALMKQRVIFVYTHDSIGLGEDGPTHQAVEQAAALRLTPNMSVWRPADSVETAVAWKAAIERKLGPTSLLLSRQGLKPQARSEACLKEVARGGYILRESKGALELIIIATGSEVEIAVAAAEMLEREGKNVRVVSMPSVDVFDAQDDSYREKVLPKQVRKRIAVEAGIADYWAKFVGLDGKVVGMRSFGESAPATDLYKHFGITAENIVKVAKGLLA